MAVVVIDTIKPKNNGTFPVVEAVDVKVTNDKRLDAALNDKANQSDVTALQTAVNGKASQSDLNALSTTVAGKQNALTTGQLIACNSGITSELVTQIGTNTTAIAGKADAADLTALEAEVDEKADSSDLTTATTSLQAQIDNIVSGSTEDSEVINARVDTDGTTYNTLKARLDADNNKHTATENSIINELPNKPINVPVGMVEGGIGTSGELRDDFTNRARSYTFLPCNPIFNIHFEEGTKHRIAYYRDARVATFINMTEWSTATEERVVFPSNESYGAIYVLVGYTDDRTITSSNLPSVWLEYKKPANNKVDYIDNYYVASDAPDVGYNTNFKMSSIIPVESGKSYKATKFRNTITFDVNLAPVRVLATTDITDNTILVGSTEKYISFCWRKDDAAEMYFTEKDDYIEGTTIDDLVPITLMGKKLSLLGDSISAYAGTIPAGNEAYYSGSNSGVTSPDQMWWKVLCNKTGMIPLVINGWSGSGITELTDSAHSDKVPMSDISRDQALHSGTTNPDVIIIAGGVNDYTYAEQASQTPSNWDGKTAPVKGNSFTETYACMIKEIQTAYPSAMVICLSSWFTMRGTDNGYTLINGENFTQSDYDREIERVASLMRVPFIDVAKCGFSRSNFYPTYAEDSSTIPTHPNAAGQKVMGEYIANMLPQIVKAFKN